MRLFLQAESRVYIDLKAAGVLRAVGHSPTLGARPPPWSLDLAEDVAIDTSIDITFLVSDIELPADISPSDRRKMGDGLRGRDVLDASRFPTVSFRGRYVGALDAGRLSGDLQVRGAPRSIALDIHGSREGQSLSARGAWEGRLTEIGIKPYTALLGALRLEDWIRLRLFASFRLR